MKKLGFGLMRLPLIEGSNEIDLVELKKMVDLFIERGFTYFDTAYMYMDYRSEKIFKEVVTERYSRDSFTITSKLPVGYLKSLEDVERIFNEQLSNCGVDYFDYYLLHNLNSHYMDKCYKYNCYDFIVKKKKEGKIKHIGFSFHDTPELLEKILIEFPEIEIVQLQINYIDWDSAGIQSRRCYEICQKYHKKVIVMEPLKGGNLAKVTNEVEKLFKNYSDASVASWGIRYAASLEDVMVVLSGMTYLDQVEDNTSYMENFVPLNSDEQKIISQAVDLINKSIEIPCTACNYCVEGCPKHILIPKYFSLYNSVKQSTSTNFSSQRTYYNVLSKDHGKASDCIKCKKCERSCPQHLKISSLLEKVKEVLED